MYQLDRDCDAVLPEERVLIEHQCRHARMACAFQRRLICSSFCFDRLGINYSFDIKLGQIQPGPIGSLSRPLYGCSI